VRIGERVIAALDEWQQRDLRRKAAFAYLAVDVTKIGVAALEGSFNLTCAAAIFCQLALYLYVPGSTKLQVCSQLLP
jgi:hypothetical protein